MDSLIAARAEQPQTTENDDVPDEEDFDDDRSDFTTESVDDLSLTDIYGLPVLCPGNEQGVGLLVVLQKMKIELSWYHQEWKQRGKTTLLSPKQDHLHTINLWITRLFLLALILKRGESFVEFSKSLPRW